MRRLLHELAPLPDLLLQHLAGHDVQSLLLVLHGHLPVLLNLPVGTDHVGDCLVEEVAVPHVLHMLVRLRSIPGTFGLPAPGMDLRQLLVVGGLVELVLLPLHVFGVLTVCAHLRRHHGVLVIVPVRIALGLLASFLLLDLLLQVVPGLSADRLLVRLRILGLLALKLLEGRGPHSARAVVQRLVLLQHVRVAQGVLPSVFLPQVRERKVLAGLLALLCLGLLYALKRLQDVILNQLALRKLCLLGCLGFPGQALLGYLLVEIGVVDTKCKLATVEQLCTPRHLLLTLAHNLRCERTVVGEVLEVRMGGNRGLEPRPSSGSQRHGTWRWQEGVAAQPRSPRACYGPMLKA
mmetsp:Transcript_4253/g.9715  ORF Transcript_4253/g.9715 Transcript_4253/m.9715 type:complete len:350 (+) Transcript_4253:233-1282(+)